MRASFEKVTPEAERFFKVLVRRDPRFAFAWHFHREFELTWIVCSRGRRFVGDHIGDYKSGDLVLIGPNLPHTWCSAPQQGGPRSRHDAVVVQFQPDFLSGPADEKVRLGSVGILLARSARGLVFGAATLGRVAPHLRRMERASPVRQLAELLLILDELSRSRDVQSLSMRTLTPQARADGTHPIDKACRFIHSHYLGALRLGQVATVVAMSESAFSRFFRRTIGKTFTAYVNELRLGHACELLLSSDRSVSDIAAASGYSNLSLFNRFFLRSRKLRPRDFRRAHASASLPL